MNSSSHSRKLAFLSFALSLLLLSGGPGASGQAKERDGSNLSSPPQMNATYASRDARRCRSLGRPPNPGEASVLVQCTMEVANSIGVRLMQNVRVEMSAPRDFQPDADGRLQDLDARAPIIPLIGSATLYFCNSVAFGLYHAGTNCSITPMQQVPGRCWKTNFGDWKCSLDEPTANSRTGQPGPTTY